VNLLEVSALLDSLTDTEFADLCIYLNGSVDATCNWAQFAGFIIGMSRGDRA